MPTLTARFPLALEGGRPMVRRIREEFEVGKRIPSSQTIVLIYPAANASLISVARRG